MRDASRILLVGCGKMGSALLDGWRARFSELEIMVADPMAYQANVSSARDIPHNEDIPFDAIVMAVKPQVMADILPDIAHLLTPRTVVMSIAAGKTIAFFEGHLGNNQPVIRVMPNTPAAVGCGVSVLCSNAHVTSVHKQLATLLMSAAGETEWLNDECLMDAVTAVSGSGPAYVFHMIEALATAGEEVGLSPALSMSLARQTVIGSARLAEHSTGTDAATLRQNVTSPGGTTEAALKVLMNDKDGMSRLMARAVDAATKRGKELAAD